VKDGTRFATYDDFDHFAKILSRRNPRTSAEHLAFIARSWGRFGTNGRVELRSDPRHKRVNPVLYQRDQAESCWREIVAPVLFVTGGLSDVANRLSDPNYAAHFSKQFRHLSLITLADAGHMLHHERPQEVAELIERFFR
jgi:pimeloyl-ACP methyl ester carboxylesterase